LAWELHESAAPAGTVLLGDRLIRNRVSFVKKELNVVPFARGLLERGLVSLAAKEAKDQWDWYYLGICHEFGRATPVDHRKAADCFRKAKKAGNNYAEFEEIWSSYLGGESALETIFRFRYCFGPLQSFAELSARALALLEMGPPREIGSVEQICRIIEISRLLHQFFFHDGGSRYVNRRVEQEMRLDIDALKAMATPSAALTLFLIYKRSRSNPAGEQPEILLRAAIHPENRSLVTIAKREIFDETQLKLITQVCHDNGWEETDICRFAVWALEHPDGEGDEDGV